LLEIYNSFKVEKLNSRSMALSSEKARIVMKKH
jgi:hypothetical protein